MECSKEEFCLKLAKAILQNKLLSTIISENMISYYSNDLVRIYCITIEGKFDNDHVRATNAIDFISKWLLLKDDNDYKEVQTFTSELVFRLAQVYTTFEYEQNDISLVYSACRILESFNENRSYYVGLCEDQNLTRSEVREKLFQQLFDLLWTKLEKLCSSKDEQQIQQWAYMYSFIYQYYPSDTLLRSVKLADAANQIEFMRLSYSIFMNETIPDPTQLISQLLKVQSRDAVRPSITNNKSSYIKMLPAIINTIHEYFASKNENEHVEDCTLMIDFHQWLISILRASKQRSQDDINNIFTCLGSSKCKWSIPVKQLLFDELVDLTLVSSQSVISSVVDRIEYLLPIVITCISNRNLLQDYKIPYHPSIVQKNHGPRLVLLDLFFFHIDQYVNENKINENLINEFMELKPPKIKDQEVASWSRQICKQFREYFLLRSAALYLCETKTNPDDSNEFMECLKLLISEYLSIDKTTVQLNCGLQIFLSTIVSKHSWSFLLDLLQSDKLKQLNSTWANILYHHLPLKQVPKLNEYLEFPHQLQFALSPNSHALSIFPHLHQPYDELNQIISTCVNNETETRWNSLSDWIQLKLSTNLAELQINDIKVMLLLNIYYNYYCNNELQLLNTLLDVIQRTLEPTLEELRVFRSLLDPEHYMIGYSQENNNTDFNYLNHLFRLDCEAVDELCIRHLLINLMVMIIKGGVKSFLWKFAFQPVSVENTYGKHS